jgi:hypothetical protein
MEMAREVYTPSESGVLPAMQEETRKTGIHTGRHLRAQLARQAAPEPRGSVLGTWLLRLVVVAILVGLLLLVFAS